MDTQSLQKEQEDLCLQHSQLVDELFLTDLSKSRKIKVEESLAKVRKRLDEIDIILYGPHLDKLEAIVEKTRQIGQNIQEYIKRKRAEGES